MKARLRFLLAVAVLGLLMTGPFLVTALLVWLEATPEERGLLQTLIVPRLPLGALLTAAGFAIGLGVVGRLFRQYVQGLLRMGEHLRLMLTANRDWRVGNENGPPEVRQLAEAINALAEQRDQRQEAVDRQIAEAKSAVEAEKNRLAALMSELAQPVVVCNDEGRILLYNHQARLQFRPLATGMGQAGALFGLGRSIFSILEQSQIEHAREVARLRQRAGQVAQAAFVTGNGGKRLLRVQLVLVQGGSGYVLSMENITRSMEEAAQRDQLIHELSEGMRGGLAVIRAAANNLVDYPDMEGEARERFLGMVADEATRLAERLNSTLDTFSDSLKTRWPLEETAGADLLAAAATRIRERIGLPVRVDESDAHLWIRVDSYAMVFAITFLAGRLREHYAIRDLRLRLTAEGRHVYLDLIWRGSNVSPETFYAWELEAMEAGNERTTLTLRDVMTRHGGEFWCQREKAAAGPCFRFVLPMAEEAMTTGMQARPEVYDFDLFGQNDAGFDLDTPLAALTCTVFDTETTGLDPIGDEIIQIGAARIVRGRLLAHEDFKQNIDPKRPVSAESSRIHGLVDADLIGAPSIAEVLPVFHAYAADTVLIAHNAAFDLRFLQQKEGLTGLAFTQPVLDTLLLSAVAQPHQASHSLEAIAGRLGVAVAGRHDALADARMTGEIFLRLLPILADAGIVTLRQALEAARRTYFARITY